MMRSRSLQRSLRHPNRLTTLCWAYHTEDDVGVNSGPVVYRADTIRSGELVSGELERAV